MADDDSFKKEQDRLLRTMTKGVSVRRGSTGARPTSWNVHLTGRAVTGAASKNEQTEALRLLQEQIRDQDNNQALSIAASNASHAEQPHTKKAVSTPASPRTTAPAAPLNLEDQAELSAFNAFNEQRELERINKWTRGGGGKVEPVTPAKKEFERPIPAVLIRQFDNDTTEHHKVQDQKRISPREQTGVVSPKAASPSTTTRASPTSTSRPATNGGEYNEGVHKFSNNVTIAAKALRQRNNEALIKASWAVVLSAKTLSLLADNDAEITSNTKTLEGATSQLKSRVDSGTVGDDAYTELSSALGQLYVSVVSLF
jgi:hypothetical protein